VDVPHLLVKLPDHVMRVLQSSCTWWLQCFTWRHAVLWNANVTHERVSDWVTCAPLPSLLSPIACRASADLCLRDRLHSTRRFRACKWVHSVSLTLVERWGAWEACERCMQLERMCRPCCYIVHCLTHPWGRISTIVGIIARELLFSSPVSSCMCNCKLSPSGH